MRYSIFMLYSFLLSFATAASQLSVTAVERPRTTKTFDVVVPSDIMNALTDPNKQFDVIYKDQENRMHSLPMESLGNEGALPPLNAIFGQVLKMMLEQGSVQSGGQQAPSSPSSSPQTPETPESPSSPSPTQSPNSPSPSDSPSSPESPTSPANTGQTLVSQETSSPSSSSSSPSSSAETSKPPPKTDYKGQVIYHHNIHRSNHSAPPISWDDGLAATAQHICNTCVYEHNTYVTCPLLIGLYE